jgi:hypothetical protein
MGHIRPCYGGAVGAAPPPDGDDTNPSPLQEGDDSIEHGQGNHRTVH